MVDGETFYKMAEVYIRGSTVKYLRIPDQVVDMVKQEVAEVRRLQKDAQKARKQMAHSNRGRGAPGRGWLESMKLVGMSGGARGGGRGGAQRH